MGQYFMIVNIDKKEFVHPHRIGAGLKFWEICANNSARVVPFLLRSSAEGGGGDADEWHDPQPAGVVDDAASSNTCGRWAGDRIIITGDYDTPSYEITVAEARADGWGEDGIKRDTKPNGMVKCTLYHYAQLKFKDISEWVVRDFNKFIGEGDMQVEYCPPHSY
jgi:hypothetical protein